MYKQYQHWFLDWRRRRWRTHMSELFFTQRFKVPVHCGSGRDLLSSLTEDAAQQESFSCHGFSLGVHLCTAAVAPRHCRGHKKEVEEKKTKEVEEKEKRKKRSGRKNGRAGGGGGKERRKRRRWTGWRRGRGRRRRKRSRRRRRWAWWKS